MKTKVLYAIILLGGLTNAYTAQLANPVPKTGGCASGYIPSGDYCKPGKNARFALQKNGVCPATYATVGGLCLASKSSRIAVPKIGVCLAGWQASGDYCLKSR